ncbi:Bug family tripartite tricarboxylate transporter substrate binding protein [Bordetella genomosp. 12]|uniref:MFS transporter n=1 Tax=Bordetella genomosp. 12 TaxID=463035 RepID=A0A261VDC7_9BORD|nr:tripartite tricarboxylate transporter substrate binding protein [Bordetella genomosp. 12]OZI71590.1 MFS transporter [Bordetella genomosp. 12]
MISSLLRRPVRLLALCLPLAGAATAHADTPAWPTRPITYIAPYPAGSPVDIITRRVGQQLGQTLGQPVIVENKVGAGGVIGTNFVAKAAPDGYTLVAGSISTHAINASLYPHLPYDPVKDFAPVALLGSSPMILVINPQRVSARTLQEFTDYARSHPGDLRFGSAGNGSSLHLAGELFKSMTHTDLVHIPYKGSVGAMNDLLGGHLDAMFENAPNALPHIQSGKLIALGVTSDHRLASLPDVPTIAETVAPGYSMATWHAVFAPAGTPDAVVQKLSTAILDGLGDSKEKQYFADRSIDLTPGGPTVLRDFVATEIPKWRKLVDSSGARLD